MKEKLLGVFQDLDFIWMTTPKGFPAMMKLTNLTKEEMLEHIETSDKLIKIPFSTRKTKELYEKYIEERKKEIKA